MTRVVTPSGVDEADVLPGVSLPADAPVQLHYVVSNTGNVPMTFTVSGAALPAGTQPDCGGTLSLPAWSGTGTPPSTTCTATTTTPPPTQSANALGSVDALYQLPGGVTQPGSASDPAWIRAATPPGPVPPGPVPTPPTTPPAPTGPTPFPTPEPSPLTPSPSEHRPQPSPVPPPSPSPSRLPTSAPTTIVSTDHPAPNPDARPAVVPSSLPVTGTDVGYLLILDVGVIAVGVALMRMGRGSPHSARRYAGRHRPTR